MGLPGWFSRLGQAAAARGLKKESSLYSAPESCSLCLVRLIPSAHNAKKHMLVAIRIHLQKAEDDERHD
jgi:hypothetical protein